MGDINGPVSLSLRECRGVYSSFFGTPMPTGMPFKDAAQEVYDRVGATEFLQLLEAVRELHKTEDSIQNQIG